VFDAYGNQISPTITVTDITIPEPAVWVLMGFGLLLIGAARIHWQSAS
jgi:hypothetical protein